MSIQIACPGCGHDYNLSDALQGKKIRCKKCEEIFTVNGAAKSVADEAIEPADKPRPGPRAAAPPAGKRRGADGETAIRSGVRTGARPVRRRGDDEEDEGPPPGKKGAAPKSKSNKMPLIIGGAVLGVVLLVGAVVGAIFLLKGGDDDSGQQVKKSNPATQPTVTQASPPQPGGGQENAKKNVAKNDVKDDVGPAVTRIEHPEAAKGNDPAVKGDAVAGLSQDVQDRVRKSTVYIEVPSGSGSGFFGAEGGLIFTAAHVLGMVQAGSPPPASIKILVNSGERDEWEAKGKILAVDHSSDLAVLKIDGPVDKCPPPLKVVPTSAVRITLEVYVVGFPKGMLVGRTVAFRQHSVSTFVQDDKTRELQRIQLEGGAGAGNFGGPVINPKGEVVGVFVSGHKEAQNVKYCIPGDQVLRVLNGKVGNVVFREPYRAGPGQPIKLPVEVQLIDPLQRLKEVGIDLWTGVSDDEVRPPTEKPPAPEKGDSQRISVKLEQDKDKHVAKGELTLPDPDADKAYWRQAFYIDGEGKKSWADGAVCPVTLPPAERRPATLIVKHGKGASRTVELFSQATYRIFDADDNVDQRTDAIKINLTETTSWVKKGAAEVALKYDKLQRRLIENGRPSPRMKSLEKSIQDAQHLRGILQLDEWGNITNSRTDLGNVPEESQESLKVVGDQVQMSMSTLAIPLRNGAVQPQEQWERSRELLIDPAGLQTAMLKLRYKYSGSRRRAGREEAIIEMTGEVAPLSTLPAGMQVRGIPVKADTRAKGFARGTAIVDVATGQVTVAQMIADVDTTLMIQLGDRGPTLRRRAGARLEMCVRRGTSVGQ